MPAIPTLGKLWQEDCCKFENSLGHTVNPNNLDYRDLVSKKQKEKFKSTRPQRQGVP